MEIKITRVYLFGGKRVKELFEEGEKKSAKIREMKKAVEAQDRQMRGYGRDFEKLLLQIKEHQAERELLLRQVELLKRMYLESEMARKGLAEKLKAATELLEAAEERENERYGESVANSAPCPCAGGMEGGEKS